MSKLAAYAQTQGLPLADAAAHADAVPDLRPAQRRALATLAELLAELGRLEGAGAPVDRILEAALDGSGLRAGLAAERTMRVRVASRPSTSWWCWPPSTRGAPRSPRWAGSWRRSPSTPTPTPWTRSRAGSP